MDFSELFQGYSKTWGLYSIKKSKRASGKIEGEARTVHGTIAAGDYRRHLSGENPGIGIIPLLDDNQSVRWGAIDIDVYSGINHAEYEKRLINAKIPSIITKSKSGGVHIWFFFREKIPAKLVQIKLTQIATFLGHSGCEVFPKQTSRLDSADVGNWINLPYFGDSRKAVIGGREAELSVFLKYAEENLLSLDDFKSLYVPQGKQFADGPPCLQLLDMHGIEEGFRNEALLAIAIYFKKRNESTFGEDVLNYNQTLEHPLGAAEVQKIVDSVQHNDYHYKCQAEPLKSYCNRQECIKREYGIGQFRGIPLQGVQLGRIDRLLTEPKLYIVELNGNRILLKNGSKDLTSQIVMRRICLDELKIYPPNVGRAEWERFIEEMTQNINDVEVPEDATPRGIFREYLIEFISKRQQSDKEAIIAGNVWRNPADGMFYFNFNYLKIFLDRENFKELSRNEMVSILQSMDGISQVMTIKGRRLNVWAVHVDGIQDQPFTTPEFKEPF